MFNKSGKHFVSKSIVFYQNEQNTNLSRSNENIIL